MDEIYQCPTCGSVGKAPKNELHSCKCRNGEEGAMTVKQLDEGLFQCPRCRGIIVFGSSEKLPLDKDKLCDALDKAERICQEKFQGNYLRNCQIDVICKEFAHAEVSEERLADIIFKERTCYTYQEMKEIYDRKSRDLSICECSMDSQCNACIWDECVNTAKAIKAELERK